MVPLLLPLLEPLLFPLLSSDPVPGALTMLEVEVDVEPEVELELESVLDEELELLLELLEGEPGGLTILFTGLLVNFSTTPAEVTVTTRGVGSIS